MPCPESGALHPFVDDASIKLDMDKHRMTNTNTQEIVVLLCAFVAHTNKHMHTSKKYKIHDARIE